jgi:hypothetical protein
MMQFVDWRLGLQEKKFAAIEERVRATLSVNIQLSSTFETINEEIRASRIEA